MSRARKPVGCPGNMKALAMPPTRTNPATIMGTRKLRFAASSPATKAPQKAPFQWASSGPAM